PGGRGEQLDPFLVAVGVAPTDLFVLLGSGGRWFGGHCLEDPGAGVGPCVSSGLGDRSALVQRCTWPPPLTGPVTSGEPAWPVRGGFQPCGAGRLGEGDSDKTSAGPQERGEVRVFRTESVDDALTHVHRGTALAGAGPGRHLCEDPGGQWRGGVVSLRGLVSARPGEGKVSWVEFEGPGSGLAYLVLQCPGGHTVLPLSWSKSVRTSSTRAWGSNGLVT